ncbi:MAG: 50S ribosomal protein L3 [Kiritimatiellae bacterium]|nr:50S ribosomal protein L3 [Kiritimatiellia bacterium]
MIGLIGKKGGMTQIYTENAERIPVTVLEVGPCVVVQRKTQKSDRYNAVQLGFSERKEKSLTKPLQGHFKKANVSGQRVLKEFLVDRDEEINVGDSFTVSTFEDVSHVDVTGISKGRGFQGVVKRYGMKGGRATHGSHFHRSVGSIGQCTKPGRVFKNKKMSGQMGNKPVTTQNLKVVAVRSEDHVLLVRGAIPGPTGSTIIVRKALKKGTKTS